MSKDFKNTGNEALQIETYEIKLMGLQQHILQMQEEIIELEQQVLKLNVDLYEEKVSRLDVLGKKNISYLNHDLSLSFTRIIGKLSEEDLEKLQNTIEKRLNQIKD